MSAERPRRPSDGPPSPDHPEHPPPTGPAPGNTTSESARSPYRGHPAEHPPATEPGSTADESARSPGSSHLEHPRTGAEPGNRAGGGDRNSAGTAGRSPDVPVPADGPSELKGPDLARAVLDAAKAKRQARSRSGRGGATRYRRRGYSGPGPDPRDPQPFGKLLERLVADRGWQRPAAEATVFGAWERVVGASIAEHCRPVKLTDGELTIEAESTAWATQLRMLSGKILAKIAQEVKPSPVRRLRIHGPSAPSWRHGPLRAPGPGPGDTYG